VSEEVIFDRGDCHGLSLEMEMSMQILKMVAYAASGSVVAGLILGGVLELVIALQMHAFRRANP
jgi:hypothetical protein